jgi:opine dehydrogenase
MRFTVIGAGHGGQALAGYISYIGYETTLYNRTAAVLEGIKRNNGIELSGYISGKAQNIALANDMGEALSNADVVMISVPANAHEDIAKNIAPHIKDTHTIIINPGRTLGAYYFAKHLRKYGCQHEAVIAETDTFVLTSRKISDGKSSIMSLKNEFFVASDTKENTNIAWKILSKPFPMVRTADSYVYTSLSNIGAIFHPSPAIFNIGRIENKDNYLHYKQGITPSICHLIEKLDYERVSLARKLGVEVPNARMWLKNVYGSQGESLYEALQNTSAYDEVIAPTEISTRYIYEDITTGIVPMYCMSKEVGSPNKILGLIIDIATEMFEYDFFECGRNDVSAFIKRYSNNK